MKIIKELKIEKVKKIPRKELYTLYLKTCFATADLAWGQEIHKDKNALEKLDKETLDELGIITPKGLYDLEDRSLILTFSPKILEYVDKFSSKLVDASKNDLSIICLEKTVQKQWFVDDGENTYFASNVQDKYIAVLQSVILGRSTHYYLNLRLTKSEYNNLFHLPGRAVLSLDAKLKI